MKKTIIGIVASAICFTLVAPDSFAANRGNGQLRRSNSFSGNITRDQGENAQIGNSLRRSNSFSGNTTRDQGENAQIGNSLRRSNSFSGRSNMLTQRSADRNQRKIEMLEGKAEAFGKGFFNVINQDSSILNNAITNMQQAASLLNEMQTLLHESGRNNYKGKINAFLSNDMKILKTLLNILTELAVATDTKKIDKILPDLKRIVENPMNLFIIKLIRLIDHWVNTSTEHYSRGVEGKYANARSQAENANRQLNLTLPNLRSKCNAVVSILDEDQSGRGLDTTQLNTSIHDLESVIQQVKSALNVVNTTERRANKFGGQSNNLQSRMSEIIDELTQLLSTFRSLKSLKPLFIKENAEISSNSYVQFATVINQIIAQLKGCITTSNSATIDEIEAELNTYRDQHSSKARLQQVGQRASTLLGNVVDGVIGKFDSLSRTQSDASLDNNDPANNSLLNPQPLFAGGNDFDDQNSGSASVTEVSQQEIPPRSFSAPLPGEKQPGRFGRLVNRLRGRK